MKFETGKTYTTRFIGDSDSGFNVEVLSRTKKMKEVSKR